MAKENRQAFLCLKHATILSLISLLTACGGSSSPSGGNGGSPSVTLTASPATITDGQSTTLTFTSSNATQGSIDNGIGAVGLNGSIHASPTQTTTYTITATGPGGTATASATVTVTPVPPPTVTMNASPATIVAGQQATLTFSSTGATTGTMDNNIGPVGDNGSIHVSPTQSTTYTITVSGPGGNAQSSATVNVAAGPSVTISASPTTITSLGESATLTVTATNASQVIITDNEDNDTYVLSPTGGSQSVTPGRTTTYTATATGINASTATAPVTVTAPTVVPELSSTGVTQFSGMSSHATNSADVDPNGAIGTKQYMEYVNVFYQAYDKVTGAKVWASDQAATNPWLENNITDCVGTISLDMVILFDHLASRWVIGGHTSAPPYYYCIAVSNTDDLTSGSLAWYAYEFPLDSILGTNAEGQVYFPDWPKLGSWADAYYVTFDLIDLNSNLEVGVVACALDRTNMLTDATPNDPQCFKSSSPLSSGVYLGHSLIPADIEGTTAPPAGRDEFMVSIENPPLDGESTTSSSFNLWDFHVDWMDPHLSRLTNLTISEAPYTPGCYTLAQTAQTICVPEPGYKNSPEHVDSVGDRFMPRFAYRNFGTYESFLVSHTVQTGTGSPNPQQTGIRWYELRSNGSGTPSLYQDSTINLDNTTFRFLPSIAQDKLGNAAVGYSISNTLTNPGINASIFYLPDPGPANEFSILTAGAEEVTPGTGNGKWGSYSSMTVDPVDDCTFWYVNEFFSDPSDPQWQTQIANFKISTCN